jgi:hypothetical protein
VLASRSMFRAEAWRSGAMRVASANPGIGGARLLRRVRSSVEAPIWPASVTVVLRVRDPDLARLVAVAGASVERLRELFREGLMCSLGFGLVAPSVVVVVPLGSFVVLCADCWSSDASAFSSLLSCWELVMVTVSWWEGTYSHRIVF